MPRLAVLALSLALALPRPAAAQEWLPTRREAAAGALLLGGALLVDAAADRAVGPGGGERWAWASDALNHGGRPQYALLLLGGAAAGGAASGRGELRDGALRVGAGMVAAGAVNGALKVAVGRERPSTTVQTLRFRPGNPDNRWQSFPSGHAVVAFSLASALTEETGDPRVAALGYTAAALVGWSRVYADKHWTSDVVGGALVGHFAGRGTVRLLRRGGEAAVPELSLSPSGVAVRITLP